MARRLYVIDASSNAYRAFYALPALANASGVPTHATLGFVTMLQKVLREHGPDAVAVVWDAPGAVERRREVYPEYKAQREATPEDLRAQIPYIRTLVEAHGLAQLEVEGEEADDVIAALTRRALEAGYEVVIVSTDRDLMQLVEDRVVLLDTMRDRRYDAEAVEKRFGVPPEQMLDLRALTGDTSDNIPGVRGIGEKGAASLLRDYGTLDNLLEHASEIRSKRQREALLAGEESARISRELSRLNDQLDLPVDPDALGVGEADVETLRSLYQELEFRRLLDDLGAAGPPSLAPVDERPELVVDAAGVEDLAGRVAGAERVGLGCALDPEESMSGELVGLAVGLDGDPLRYVVMDGPVGEAARERLGPALARADLSLVGHDLKRVAVALSRRGAAPAGPLRDVAVAAYVLDPSQQVQRPEVLAKGYLGKEIPAVEDVLGRGARRRGARDVPTEALAAFLAAQVRTALELDDVLARRLEETGQRALYEDVEIPLVSVLARMEEAGVRVDESRLRDLSIELESEMGSLESSIYALAGEKFNINSPKQLQKILFEKHKLPPTKRTKTGFSTDESVLAELALSYDLPREIMTYRRMVKLKGTYVDALPPLVNPQTGRIHCTFHQTVAATGRLSCSNPNLQNIPVRTPVGQQIRDAFIPAEGRVLLSADYSQIELRVLAYLSEDEVLLDAFRSGEDIHVRTAASVFDIPPEQVSPEQRDRMKAVNFGILYGSSAFGIAQQLGIAQNEAREHIRAYFERYPRVRDCINRLTEQARERGFAETIYGRRRPLPDLRSRNRVIRSAAERMAVNSVIQGTAADIIKRAMVDIDPRLGRPGAPRARMILQIHDELLFEVAPEEADALGTLVVERMGSVADLGVPLEVHVGVGKTWREAH
jgi:DNA polymerase-1